MKTIDELTNEFEPYYPKLLLKYLVVAEYNKSRTLFGIEITSRMMFIIYHLILITIMIISYEINDSQMNVVVWFGIWVFVLFVLSIFLFICFVWYNNFRIKIICKKHGYTLKEWNDSIKYKK